MTALIQLQWTGLLSDFEQEAIDEYMLLYRLMWYYDIGAIYVVFG